MPTTSTDGPWVNQCRQKVFSGLTLHLPCAAPRYSPVMWSWSFTFHNLIRGCHLLVRYEWPFANPALGCRMVCFPILLWHLQWLNVFLVFSNIYKFLFEPIERTHPLHPLLCTTAHSEYGHPSGWWHRQRNKEHVHMFGWCLCQYVLGLAVGLMMDFVSAYMT